MANEAILRQRIGEPIDFTTADTSSFLLGHLGRLVDPRTFSGSNVTVGIEIAGIAARDKVASDTRTQIATWRTGIFDMVASGAIGLGQKVMAAGHDNMVKAATALVSGAEIIGTSLETASADEVVQIHVNVGAF